jgi:pimeloyl-ACP methyl ester carboxylesterase
MPWETVEIDGQRLAYRTSRGGGRAVVLVHGNSSSSATWRHLLEGPFGDRFRCLALDLPGHGDSAPAPRRGAYSLPGYARVLSSFAGAVDARDAVFVGWSLGGHIALEAVPSLPAAAGFVIFGTPPMASPADIPQAFLPNPAVSIGFQRDVTADDAAAYAASFVAPGSPVPLDDFTAGILATDGEARDGLSMSLNAGEFADELALVADLRVPLAILHGTAEQLVNLDYLRTVRTPTLWREEIQLVADAGHAPQEEQPEAFESLLTQFLTDLG